MALTRKRSVPGISWIVLLLLVLLLPKDDEMEGWNGGGGRTANAGYVGVEGLFVCTLMGRFSAAIREDEVIVPVVMPVKISWKRRKVVRCNRG